MPRTSIQLNAEKVKLLIARKNLTNKAVLTGMTDKTVYRIKAGRKTSQATAEQLAMKLDTTVDDLMTPVMPKEFGAFLPDQWLDDEAQSADSIPNHLPFCSLVGNGNFKYLVGRAPVDMFSPMHDLLKWQIGFAKRVVLRQEKQAFVLEIQYFDYSPDHAQRVEYQASTACRFFPLGRNGDTFTKTALSPLLHAYLWSVLRQEALANAELVSIEGYDYPDHPEAYFPVVRFFQGSAMQRRELGARIFEHLHRDFRCSLIQYLEGLGKHRFRARTSTYGIHLTVDAVRPAIFKPGWQDEVLDMEILLAWRRPDGRLALAPWRKEFRGEFAKGMSERQWDKIYSRHTPFPRFRAEDDKDDEDDQGPLPFEADPDLAPGTLAAIHAIDYPDSLPLLWEAQLAEALEQTGQQSA
jgi:hypothetical protein